MSLNKHLLLIVLLALCLVQINLSCKNNIQPVYCNYGTASDSARYYFIQGWKQILDNGQWTSSEYAFRRAVEFDPDFLIGLSLVGRISQNLAERKTIYAHLKNQKMASAPMQLLLSVFISNIEIMNKRDQGVEFDAHDLKSHRDLAERNFRIFLDSFPNEHYIKAEYIETLHAKYGASNALDSLLALTDESEKYVPFYLGYEALLRAELGQYELAHQMADEMNNKMKESSLPARLVIKAQIYMNQDSFQRAKPLIDQALKLDSNHLIASGLQAKINSAQWSN